jgi:hypothetical protein
MRGKYITLDIRMACLSKPSKERNDIHGEIHETINERKKLMQQLENYVQTARVVEMFLGDLKAA